MKIIHVIPTLASRTGGPAYAILQLSRALAARGIETPVLSTDLSTPARVGSRSKLVELQLPSAAADCDVQLFPIEHFPQLAYAPELGRALHAMVPSADIVHIHSLFLYPTYAAFRVARALDKPYIVFPHGSLDPWIRKRGRLRKAAMHLAWQSRLFRHAAAVQAATPEEAALWPEYARRPRVEIVPYGIDLAEFDDMPSGQTFRHELGIGGDEQLIVNVGRIAEKKGLDVLIRATARLHRSGLQAHVALVGPDDENLQPRLQAIANAEQVSSHVHFTGSKEGREKLSALAAADVWALPSHTENFAIAVVEALAAGCPVVVSTEVNLAPQIAAANAGLVASPTVADTAAALRRLLESRDLRDTLSANGRTFASTFDWGMVADQMIDVYDSLLKHRPTTRSVGSSANE